VPVGVYYIDLLACGAIFRIREIISTDRLSQYLLNEYYLLQGSLSIWLGFSHIWNNQYKQRDT